MVLKWCHMPMLVINAKILEMLQQGSSLESCNVTCTTRMTPFIIKFTFQQNIRNVKQSTTTWIIGSQFSTQQMSVLEMNVAVSEVCNSKILPPSWN